MLDGDAAGWKSAAYSDESVEYRRISLEAREERLGTWNVPYWLIQAGEGGVPVTCSW